MKKNKKEIEGRPTKDLKIDETLLSEEERAESKPSVPWGILIFCGVIALIMIALIIVIVNIR